MDYEKKAGGGSGDEEVVWALGLMVYPQTLFFIVQRYAFSGADIKAAIRKIVLSKIWAEQQRLKVDSDIIA